MAYKVLGQSAPSATTATDLYTVPSSVSAVVSTLVVCNRGGSATTYRVSVRAAGAADATKQYLAYDVALPGNSTDFLTLGITLATTDVVTVYAGNANVSFNLFGNEA
jgi:hypothetical protein